MKILIVGQFESPLQRNYFRGGVQRAERLQAYALSTVHRVTLVTAQAEYHPPHYDIIEATPRDIPDIVRPRKYDLVISNAKRTPVINAVARITHTPVIHVLHVLPGTFGMAGVQLVQCMAKAHHPVFTVSPYAAQHTYDYLHSRKVFADLDTNWFNPTPVFPLGLALYNFTQLKRRRTTTPITIGRNDPERKLHIAIAAGAKPFTPDDGLPYSRLMHLLSTAPCCVNPLHAESYGLVPFEAAERGTPTVQVRKGPTHSTDAYMPPAYRFSIDTYRMREQKVVEHIMQQIAIAGDLPYADRKDLAEQVFTENNVTKWLEKFNRVLGVVL